MATQMQLEVILAGNRIATGVLWSRIPVLIYTEILSRENWEQVKSRIGGEATCTRVCLFTKPCNISDLKDLKKILGSAKTMHFCVYLNFHTKEFPKFGFNLSRVHFCKPLISVPLINYKWSVNNSRPKFPLFWPKILDKRLTFFTPKEEEYFIRVEIR